MATENNNQAPAPLDHGFAAQDYLALAPVMPLERSALLDDGKILTASIDPDTGEFLLARHLKSGRLDHGFGLRGVQRVASDIVRSVTSLSLRLEANGRVVLQGNLSDPVTGRKGVYLLRVLPTVQSHPRLGMEAFLIVSLLPTASVMSSDEDARDEWTWLRWQRWPSCQAQ
ncbi:MAG: hypothetical protein LBJ37_24960 [Paucimonas sp.]|jgi:hypothetical protein|nr:hypothetical protein [Paucimonas sp.]